MVSLKFSVILLCLLSLAIITQAQDPTYLYHNCPNTTTYTRNSTYQANLNLILSSLSSNATRNNINGFSNVSAGQAPDVVYGMFLCRGDVRNSVCRNCVNFATKDVLEKCPIEEVAMIWYDECELRYSNRNFFSTVDQNFTLFMMSPNNVTVEPDRFDQLVATTINNISAASGAKKFAVQQANYTGVQKLYTLVQCTPDLSTSDCSRCLEGAISKLGSCCNRKQGGRVKFPSCNFRYELYEFYNATPAVEAVPAPPLATPSPPPASGSKTSGKGNRRIWMIIILTVAGALLVVVILGSFIYCLMKRNGIEKWKKENSRQIDIAQGIGRPSRTDFQLQSFHRDGLDVQESSSMDLASIGKATNNFSSSNFIGKGGFGPVYKGILSDGKEVAVKRLSTWSGQGIREFTNEVRLIINLRHKNLVKLHGFYVDREEKLLVYEFMPNSSLDVLLFDPKKRAQLNWQTRIGIINGIAEGTLYLHEDSRRTIIHRDLKASNVLLDKDMNPKISDFGMARMFAGSEVETNTARIAGTFGYMAPEYAMEGLYSIKSDVFSFGVLLLEIITGKRNSGFKSKHASSLLAYAWSLWNEGHELELIDSLLADSCCSDEFSRYMHVGLLCVQEDFSGRPTMSSVVSMLKNGSSTLPKPKRPGFFAWTFTGHHNKANASKCSVNGLTISDILPR